MSKVAFIFPGQGSQSVGMCKDLYENYACARRTFEEADEALGFSISNWVNIPHWCRQKHLILQMPYALYAKEASSCRKQFL